MLTLGSDVLANLLAAFVLGILTWIAIIVVRLPFVLRKRRNLLAFFGLTKNDPNLIVYFSTVYVASGGSLDFKGQPRTFAGPAIPATELNTVAPIAMLFSNTLLDSLPSSVRTWLGNKLHWSFRNIGPVFLASPQSPSQVEKGNIVTVGSQYYNSAGDLYTETGKPFLKMEQTGMVMVIRVKRGQRTGDVFTQRPEQADDLAIVEKLYDQATKSTVFIAAGLGVVGTMGAVQFLVENWAKLHKDFGAKPFAICLRFQNVANDPNAFKRPIELSRFQED